MVAKRMGEPIKSIEKQIRTVLTEKIERNGEGFYFQNGADILRTLNKDQAIETIKNCELNNLLTHFRFASVGKVTEANVHGWRIGEWTFFHNGGISTYTNWNQQQEQDYSDSYQLFQALYLKLSLDKNSKDQIVSKVIEEHLKTVNFWGRAALYNNKTDKMFLFGDFHVYALSSKYLIISSCLLDFDTKAEKDIHGIKFEFNSITHNGELKIDGIWVIKNFSKDNFEFSQLLDKLPTYTYQSKANNFQDDPQYKFDSNWEKVGRTWQRKPQKNISVYPQLNAPDIEMTPERQEILDNINFALADTTPINKPYSEKELQSLFDDKEFWGWDENGNELYSDSYGLHDKTGGCCFYAPPRCRDWNDVGMFVCKDEVLDFKKELEKDSQVIDVKI